MNCQQICKISRKKKIFVKVLGGLLFLNTLYSMLQAVCRLHGCLVSSSEGRHSAFTVSKRHVRETVASVNDFTYCLACHHRFIRARASREYLER